ncbi:hypothetical protein [Ramlibacter humi]|uniref:Secreted protein n=1 Tax=Ramlibacter humi TaxID=2530451 RepID=A0A4Z0BIY0_9BURK|nr:hypothetical protein [Ramlibacter humi]TFY98369.1 hypothetical protein EZ216_17430 [Ramlibacter humi]
MDGRLLRCMVAIGALAFGGEALAEPGALSPPKPQAVPSGCHEPEHAGNPLLHRDERIRQYENLGEPCLKRLLVECNAAASRQLLDEGQAFACSIGYEALLKRGFGGDFQAMLAWWRTAPERTALN